MIEKIVELYRKAEMGIISDLAGSTNNVLEETNFYDTGYMQAQVSRIQREINRVTKELELNLDLEEDSDYVKTKRKELFRQKENLLFHLIFLGSNSFTNLDDCIKMANGHDFTFMKCVDGLQAYKSGEKEKAFQILEAYYRGYGSIEEHYLVNKVFGLLLREKGAYQKAVPFLTYALQFVPDDLEALESLRICYHQTEQIKQEDIVSEVLSILI